MSFAARFTDFDTADRARLAALANARLPMLVTLVLVLLLGWQLARLAWLLVPAPASGDPVQVAAPPPGAAAAATTANIERIASAHLFGEAREEDATAPPPEPTEDLQDTRLALTLKGTHAGSDDKLSSAIIADNRNDEKVYFIGDAVAAGTTLHAVYRDQVVLNRNGSLEALRLPKDLPSSSAAPMGQLATTRLASEEAVDTSTIQSTLTENAAKLADVIRPTPYFVGGQQQGYRVYPGRNRQQFAALGLRPGDLIKDIDGQALTDPQQAMQIFQNLGTADQVSVTVERNGQPEVLVLTTSQLDLGGENEQ